MLLPRNQTSKTRPRCRIADGTGIRRGPGWSQGAPRNVAAEVTRLKYFGGCSFARSFPQDRCPSGDRLEPRYLGCYVGKILGRGLGWSPHSIVFFDQRSNAVAPGEPPISDSHYVRSADYQPAIQPITNRRYRRDSKAK